LMKGVAKIPWYKVYIGYCRHCGEYRKKEETWMGIWCNECHKRIRLSSRRRAKTWSPHRY